MLTTKRLGTAALASAALLTFAALPMACSGGKETLVVAALKGQPDASGLDAATVTIGGTQKAFPLHGLSSTATKVGIYLPSSVSGAITVAVSATGGGACYRGSALSTIVTVGVEVDVDVTLTPDTNCAAGAAGAGGGGGNGGGSGSGGSSGGAAGAAGGAAGAAGGAGGAAGGAAGAAGGAAGAAGGAAGAAGAAGGTTGTAGAAGGSAGVGGTGGVPHVLAWSAAENIEKDVINASFEPVVAIDATHGNVLVAWTDGDYPGVKRYDAATKMWSATKLLDNRGSIRGASVVMDDLGHAVAVWYQNDNNTPPAEIAGLWFAHSEDGGVSWSVPARIHNGPAWGDLAFKMAADGSARLAWDETDGVTRTLWSASYSAVTKTFTGAAAVKTGSDVYERHARMAMSPKGPGVLVWVQRDTAGYDSVWGSSFATAGGALSTPVLVDANVTNDIYDPSVAISPDGTHGIVAWDTSATTDEVWTADWTMAGGFVASARAFSGGGVAAPGVAIDATYVVTMAWSQMLASGKWNVTASRRPAGAGAAWGTPTVLETTNMAGSFTDQYAYPSVAADGAGNVHVLWRRKIVAGATNNTYGEFVRVYSAGVWQPEVSLGTKTGLPAFSENLAVAADGHAAATFFYGDPDCLGDMDAYNVFVALFK